MCFMKLKIKYLIIPVIIQSLFCIPQVSKYKIDKDTPALLTCSMKGNKVFPGTNASRFGFFSSKLWDNYEENLLNEIDVFGVVPGYLLWYVQFGEDFPLQITDANNSLGIKTVINHDLRSDNFSTANNIKILNEISSGEWDSYLSSLARKIKAVNYTVYYRFGYEMNGDWFPWGGKPKEFVTAWKHVYKIFKKNKVHNVVWIWSPSVIWGNKTFEKDILPYYPGDQYVDIVALDGYNFGDDHTKHHKWESFDQVFSKSLAGIMTFNKPMWIAEIGCPTDPRRHQWLQDFLTFFDSNHCFEVFLWFNEFKKGEPNFRIDADMATLNLFRQWAQGTKYQIRQKDELAIYIAPPYEMGNQLLRIIPDEKMTIKASHK